MIVGLGGNNGTTTVAGVLANREYAFFWESKLQNVLERRLMTINVTSVLIIIL